MREGQEAATTEGQAIATEDGRHRDVPDLAPQRDVTSGTDDRPARELRRPLLAFDLESEVARLRAEPGFLERSRVSKTLAKDRAFRVVLSLLGPGAAIGENDMDGPFSLHVLDGSLTVARGGDSVELRSGQIGTLSAGSEPWSATATSETILVLTVAWPTNCLGA